MIIEKLARPWARGSCCAWLGLLCLLPAPASATLFFSPTVTDRNALLAYSYYNLSIDPFDSSKAAALRPCQELSLRLVRGLDQTDFGTQVATELGLTVGLLPNEATLYETDSTGAEVEKNMAVDRDRIYPFPLFARAGVVFVPYITRNFNAGIGAGFGLGIEPYPLLSTYLMPSLSVVVVPNVVALNAEVMFVPLSPTYQQDIRNSVVKGQCLVAVNPPHFKVNLVAGFWYQQWANERPASRVKDIFTAYGMTVGVNFNLGTQGNGQ